MTDMDYGIMGYGIMGYEIGMDEGSIVTVENRGIRFAVIISRSVYSFRIICKTTLMTVLFPCAYRAFFDQPGDDRALKEKALQEYALQKKAYKYSVQSEYAATAYVYRAYAIRAVIFGMAASSLWPPLT